MIEFLIYDILRQWGIKESGQFLIEAFEREGSPAFLADIYVSRGEELGVFGNSPRDEACISKEDFEAIGQLLTKRIDAGYKENTLADAPFYYNIVRCWSHLSDCEAAKTWLTEGMADNAKFMAKVCKGLVAYSVDENGRHYSMEERPDARWCQLDVLVKAGSKHCNDSKLTEDERRRISAVVVGAKRFCEADVGGSIPAEEK